MGYCSNCGSFVKDGANFCGVCGKKIEIEKIDRISQREMVYEGEVHKCPNCGEIIKGYTISCPNCGHEFRNTNASSAIYDLQQKIYDISQNKRYKDSGKKKTLVDLFKYTSFSPTSDTEDMMIATIKAFPIPNTKEDIIDFMILASSNIDYDAYNEASGGMKLGRRAISSAWEAKMQQAYSKAKILFPKDSEFEEIKKMYTDCQKKIKRSKAGIWRLLLFVILLFIVCFGGIYLLIKFG